MLYTDSGNGNKIMAYFGAKKNLQFMHIKSLQKTH